MADIVVKFFGNGKKFINPDKTHVVETKEYYNLTVRDESVKLPPNKRYIVVNFNDDTDGSFVSVRHQGKMVDINSKVVDYLGQLKAQ